MRKSPKEQNLKDIDGSRKNIKNIIATSRGTKSSLGKIKLCQSLINVCIDLEIEKSPTIKSHRGARVKGITPVTKLAPDKLPSLK